MAIEEPLRFLVKVGVIDIILPFILVFTLIFGVLQRTQVLGKDNRKTDAIVASILGLIAIIAVNVLQAINTLVRYLSLLIVTGVLIALIYGMVGADMKKPSKAMTALLVIVFAITAFFSLAQAGIIDKESMLNTILLPLIVLSGILATIAYVLSPKKEKEVQKMQMPEISIKEPYEEPRA